MMVTPKTPSKKQSTDKDPSPEVQPIEITPSDSQTGDQSATAAKSQTGAEPQTSAESQSNTEQVLDETTGGVTIEGEYKLNFNR